MTDPRLARPTWRGRTNVDALTIGCIEHAEQIVAQVHPGIAHEFVITQGSYQAGAGDPLSAGTHDLGGVVDLRWCGHNECILALRLAGMAATWHRTPAQGPWPNHIHAVVRDHPNQAESAQRQTVAVLAGRNGLANNAPDDGPRPNPFPHPVWPWPEEDTMTPAQEKKLDEVVGAIKSLADTVEKMQDREQARDERTRTRDARLVKLVRSNKATTEDILAALATEED